MHAVVAGEHDGGGGPEVQGVQRVQQAAHLRVHPGDHRRVPPRLHEAQNTRTTITINYTLYID